MYKKDLKKIILESLENCPDTRNSDIKLTNFIWINYFPDLVSIDKDGEYTVKLLDLYKLPREDNVKRIRAKIQNEEHLFLPTDPEVRKKRKISEQEWRIYLNCGIPLTDFIHS